MSRPLFSGADRPRLGAGGESDFAVSNSVRCLTCRGKFDRPRACKELEGRHHPCPTCGTGTPVTTDMTATFISLAAARRAPLCRGCAEPEPTPEPPQ